MTNMSRSHLLSALTQLLPAQFEALLLDFNMPPTLVRRNATQTEQAIDLIRYAESRNELDDLEKFIVRQQQAARALPQSERVSAFNQSNQHVGQQFNVAGDVHIHGDAVAGDKIVQTVTGNGNVFSGSGDVRVDDGQSRKRKE